MSIDFYNKIAKRFGGYAFGTHHVEKKVDYKDGNPEEIFKEKVLSYAGQDKKALDAGCGDGKFAFDISQSFQTVIGIDTSDELIKIAEEKKSEMKINNVQFFLQDARNTTFESGSFDVVYSRRGPTTYSEYFRILKTDGFYVGIRIGEKDCQSIKQIFGYGQGYGEWENSKLESDKAEMENIGFEVVFTQNYLYDEYYSNYGDLDYFLQGVPIFEDYDSKKDEYKLKKYIAISNTEYGIIMPRHRIVFVARKIEGKLF